ncbi:hypothetical protein BDF14DRAFT_1746602 [Spinellus fusiger]|nr:hypothetical protein BDF14DRAFT_1746602 [Spinellus fusiger]
MLPLFSLSAIIAATVGILSVQGAIVPSAPDFMPVSFLEVSDKMHSLNETFSNFHWNGQNAMARETYTFELAEPSFLQITDYKNSGDVFVVYDNDTVIGETSAIPESADKEVFAGTPEAALSDDRFSQGVFPLAVGAHKISIFAKSPYEAGTAAIRMMTSFQQALYKKGKWDHGGDDDEEDEDEEEEEEEGEEEEGLHQWPTANHYKKTQDVDYSHTITLTKTKWITEYESIVPLKTLTVLDTCQGDQCASPSSVPFLSSQPSPLPAM